MSFFNMYFYLMLLFVNFEAWAHPYQKNNQNDIFQFFALILFNAGIIAYVYGLTKYKSPWTWHLIGVACWVISAFILIFYNPA